MPYIPVILGKSHGPPGPVDRLKSLLLRTPEQQARCGAEKGSVALCPVVPSRSRLGGIGKRLSHYGP